MLVLPSTVRAAATEEPQRLQLEVYINGAPTHLIGSFFQLADQRLAADRAELAELGIKVPGSGKGDERIVVNDLPAVAYRYDLPTQSIFFTLGDQQRVTQNYDLRPSGEPDPHRRNDFGGVLNYTLFAASTRASDSGGVSFSGANASLDGRFFGPYGTLSQTGILGSTTTPGLDALRLDTTWSYSDQPGLLTYRAGDTISGGLAWTRPIRIGGAQMQRNFGLRPDLVTLPLPTVSGSAAVPSSLDVYIDNVKVHSQELPAGPYQITNIPVLSGAGTARVVVHDAAGRQIETRLPFYASPKLLKQDFMDFSAEAGLPRLDYARVSNSYAADPVASATMRRGLSDWFTLEAHGEAGAGLANAGVGSLTGLGDVGVLSLAGSGSRLAGATGMAAYAAYDTRLLDIEFHASAWQAFGTYNDLASATARFSPSLTAPPGVAAVGFTPAGLQTSARPPKSLDTASIGLPLLVDASSVNLGYVHQVLTDGTRADIVNVSYSRTVFTDVSLYATAFSDLHDHKTSGVFLGLSLPLGRPSPSGAQIYGSTGVTAAPGAATVTTEVARPQRPENDSYGWRVRDSEGSVPYRAASGSYRSSVAQIEGAVQQFSQNTSASLQVSGAVAAMDGGVFLANRIDDAFAVVNAGAPGIGVLNENRLVGKTDSDGQLLVPDLKSYQPNKISIDARDLPVNADAPLTRTVIAPADRNGVTVGFGIVTDVKSAVVLLTGKDGKFIAPGLRGRLDGTEGAFLVGYDGRAYVTGLGPANTIVVDLGGSECRAAFPFAPQKNSQVVIGPVVCQ